MTFDYQEYLKNFVGDFKNGEKMQDSEKLRALPDGTRVEIQYLDDAVVYIKDSMGLKSEKGGYRFQFDAFDGWGDDQTITVLD